MVRTLKQWLALLPAASFSRPKLPHLAASIADQGLAVGGMLLANVALARAQSKEEYGMFALSYSVFTFIAGLHNAALVETYTVYGSGRYQQYGHEYGWLIWRSNALLGCILTAALSVLWLTLRLIAPALASRSFLGMALSSGVLLSGGFLRRMLYVQRKPLRAAKLSSFFFVTVAVLLALSIRAGILNGLTAFLIVAAGWIAGGLSVRQELPRPAALDGFHAAQPRHWSAHWKYARWVLATAFVFQLTTQAYYWISAGLLSLKDVADLRVLYIVVTPVDQIFVALTLLVLPLMASRYAARQLTQFVSLWKSYALGNTLITVLFALAVRGFGRPVMHWIYGGKFDDVADLLGVLALLPVIMGLGNVANVALKAVEKPKFVLYSYIASGAATFLIGMPLVRHFRLPGAVYGMLISAAVYTTTMAIGLIAVATPRLKSARVVLN